MSKWGILVVACVIWPSAVCAGQATSQFAVGITITGKRASTTTPPNAATEPVPTANPAAAAKSKPATRKSLLHKRRAPKFGSATPRVSSP
jgi:hypothetical protein